jgi:hypothetical protein
MMTYKRAIQIVKEFFPSISDEDADNILWNRTGWPAFFQKDEETSLKESLCVLKDTIAKGHKPCEYCSKPAKVIKPFCIVCKECFMAMDTGNYWWCRLKTILGLTGS